MYGALHPREGSTPTLHPGGHVCCRVLVPLRLNRSSSAGLGAAGRAAHLLLSNLCAPNELWAVLLRTDRFAFFEVCVDVERPLSSLFNFVESV